LTAMLSDLGKKVTKLVTAVKTRNYGKNTNKFKLYHFPYLFVSLPINVVTCF
jgi:hypothetical protein